MIPFLSLRDTNKKYYRQYERAFQRVFSSGQYILGEELERFEQDFAAYCDADHCIGLDNGTNALFLAVKALQIPTGSEVIIAANSYISAFLAVLENDLVPVPVDIDWNTFHIDDNLIRREVNGKTKAILVTHMYGSCVDMDRIKEIATQAGLFVIDDCSHAHGATYKGKKAGSLADISTFSFYPTKNLGAMGDAGGITTNHAELAGQLLRLRNYGFVRKNEAAGYGYNSRLDEVQAALLNLRLHYLDKDNMVRRMIADQYLNGINNPLITLPKHDPESAWSLFVIRCESRDRLQAFLAANGIGSAIHYPVAFYNQKPFRHLFNGKWPVSDKVHQQVISIPLNLQLTQASVDYIIDILNQYK